MTPAAMRSRIMGSRRISHAIASKLRGLAEGSSFGPSASSRAAASSWERPRNAMLLGWLVIKGGTLPAVRSAPPGEVYRFQNIEYRECNRQDHWPHENTHDAKGLYSAE